MKLRKPKPTELAVDGPVRTALPKLVHAEDFSILVRGPRRVRYPFLLSNRNFLNLLH